MGKGIRKITFSFEDSTLTHFGGMTLFQRFCRKLDLKGILQRHTRWQRRSAVYHPVELLQSMIYTMVAGMGRIYDTRIIQYNGCFQELLGLKEFPKPSTLREFLKRITLAESQGIIRVHDLLRRKIWNLPHSSSSLIFDLDSTVLPVFGWRIEGAKVGYNPAKPGRPSYHPLICFEAHSRDISQERVQNLRYRTFRKGGWQAAQFTYQPHNWKRPHRFIVVRRPKPKSQEEDNQLTLWEFKDYFYHTFVTNLSLSPENIWHFYKPRARCELDIRELKESFPLGNIPTNSFLANQVHFHLILLTYDLVNWFKRLCLPQEWNSAALHTLRRDLFALPARLVHAGGRNQLKLPQRYPHQKLFYQTLSRIEHLKIT